MRMMQVVAMITMLVDHIGALFFPETSLFRIVGRIAFPLYCWFLVQGYRYTRDHKRYMLRLLWLACLSQVPYSLAMQTWELNVIFTLLLSLVGMYVMDRVQSENRKVALIACVLAAATLIPMDYGLYGVLLIFVFRYLEQWKMIAGHLLVNLIFTVLYGSGYLIQMYSLIGTFLIVYPLPLRFEFHYRWLYRSFYPVHLLLLFLIYMWIR